MDFGWLGGEDLILGDAGDSDGSGRDTPGERKGDERDKALHKSALMMSGLVLHPGRIGAASMRLA